MKNLFESLKTGSLIGKYLTGRESEKESAQLKDWLEQDSLHRDLFKSIKDKQQLAKAIEEFENFDKEEAWEKYIELISKHSRKRIQFRWKIAASIIAISVLSSIALLNYFSGKEPATIEVAQQILPGEPKAYLELGNGIKYDLQNLSEQQENRLIEEAGILVEGNTVINSKTDETDNIEPKLITLVTPRGGEYKMVLEDGTEVWMNADSKLVFPDKFKPDSRHVKLIGEAYFKVVKDINRPFVVSLKDLDVEVLGTEFNVTAYNNDNFIKTTLVEGEVAIKKWTGLGVEKKVLSPGDQASFNKTNKSMEINQVDVNQYIAWKDGRFVFAHQSLEDITKILERWYDVDFVFASDEIKNIPFSGEFLRYGDITKVYEIIKKTGTKLKFKQTNRTIEISN